MNVSILRPYIVDNVGKSPAEIRDIVIKDYPNEDSQVLRNSIKQIVCKAQWYAELLATTKDKQPARNVDRVSEVKQALDGALLFRDSELRIYLGMSGGEWNRVRLEPALKKYQLEVKNGPRKGLWWANEETIAEVRERCDVL